ncbi:MAG: 4-hydroxy-3-methylbut-2-enyl diphosphate reductase [Zavarzinella sp.]
MRVLLANPRGFCAGVNMAVEALETAIKAYGTPLYVYHEIVHNHSIVERFRNEGVVFVDSVDEVPTGATLMYSAHGVSPAIREASKQRNLRTIDATCPLVTKVHTEAVRYAKDGYHIIFIGHEGHDEVIGTMGEAPDAITLVESEADVAQLQFGEGARLAYLTQTTLSVDETRGIIAAIKNRFPQVVGPNKSDICYATQNRQEAVQILSSEVDRVIVLGSQNSSNSRRLQEIALAAGKPAYLVDGVADLSENWFSPTDTVLITAGASAPEEKVQEVVQYLQANFQAEIDQRVIRQEDVHFQLPRELRSLPVIDA